MTAAARTARPPITGPTMTPTFVDDEPEVPRVSGVPVAVDEALSWLQGRHDQHTVYKYPDTFLKTLTYK